MLLNFSYRGSERDGHAATCFASNAVGHDRHGQRGASRQIGIAEGSWVINSRSLLTFKYNALR